jgi:hypothetical protein
LAGLLGPVLSPGNWPISVNPSWQASITGRLLPPKRVFADT